VQYRDFIGTFGDAAMKAMTDKTDAYAAQITLTLPGRSEAATIVVSLAPADMIPLGGEAKPLSECTLAELRAYGDALEAEVWDAYKAITLHELAEDGQIDIRVATLDDSGKATGEIDDWLKQAIVFSRPEPEQTAPEEQTVTAEVGVIGDPSESSVGAEETAQPETPPIVEVLPATEPAVTEPPVARPAQPEPEPSPPTIIPSQARVRVAGGRLPLAESGGAAADVLLDEAPLRAMQAHALSSLDREVAGVMIGRQPEKQPDGRYVVHVIDSIAAKYTVMNGASVTYTPESWRYLNDTLQERYPDESAVMVGWYHTHPGFGIFLSGMDLFIHENFFTQIWHVAYVLDPRARASGFFCWNRQKTKVNRYDFLWPDWATGSW
jgi:proteasome lid subunit RPN8/RPN11